MAPGPATTILIVEDGDEYLDNLSRFVAGPRYLQAHNGREALDFLTSETVHLIYLDMRFDRIPLSDLLGDHTRATNDHNGDPARAWRYLQNNQGLFILHFLGEQGFGHTPVILAYDFSREVRRLDYLKKNYPNLGWVPDAVTPEEIRKLIRELTGR